LSDISGEYIEVLLDSGRLLKEIDRRQHTLKNKGAEIMTRYLVSIIAAAFAAAFLCVSVGNAQEAKFGFVDMQKFTQDSVKFKGQQKKLMDLYTVKKTALESRATELQKLKDEVQRQAGMMAEGARNEKIKEVTMKETEFKIAEQEAKNALQSEEQSMMQALQEDMKKIIGKIRQDRKLALVFNSAALLSSDDAFDITADVAKAYDADASIPGKPGTPPNPKPTPKAPPVAPGQPKKAPGAK
jgi:Skp family chaperone for outer membrane proteins